MTMNYMNNLGRLLFATAAVWMASCHADLDIMQDNKLSVSNMWKSSVQVESSTYGIYSALRENFVQDQINILFWGELRVGGYMWGPSHVAQVWVGRDVIENIMTSSTASANWSKLYSAIDQANAVLKYAPLVPMTDAQRSWAVGQAAFARAYCYFWAARLWGDVPLNLNPIESVSQPETYPSRAPKAEVYAQIAADIRTALDNAPNLGKDKYLATPDAVNMLKAEYALWMYTAQKGGDGYLEMAEEALSAIGVKAGDARFMSRYSEVFDGHGAGDKNSAEVVFALYNSQSEKKLGGFSWYFTYASTQIPAQYQQKPVPIMQAQWLDYGDDFIAKLRDSRDRNGDTRVGMNLGDGPYGNDGRVITWPNKFIGDLSTSSMVKDCDILYYRYALAVMMDAELKYYRRDYQGALSSLNIIAKRAYNNDKFYTDATDAGVLQALCDEYLLEFPCEGVVWWALIRLDRIWEYNAYLKARRDDTNILLWPVSKSARDKNSNLTQTEGWY